MGRKIKAWGLGLGTVNDEIAGWLLKPSLL